jgi:hypothetical protein
MARWHSNRDQLRQIAASLILLWTVSVSRAETFNCTVTLTRVLVRSGEDWKEITNRTVNQTLFRELTPAEKRGGKTWGFFPSNESKPALLCTRYDFAIACGNPGNTIDFNLRAGRYVRTYFASFVTRESSEISIEAGRCSADQ